MSARKRSATPDTDARGARTSKARAFAMRGLCFAVLRLDGQVREDEGGALAVEVPAARWRQLVALARKAVLP